MQYTQDMILHSPTGYCMPFEEKDGEVRMTLPYGEQRHPQTQETFFHHGVDFEAPRYLLYAVAGGTVTGIGTDAVLGTYQVIRHGDYEVRYCHLDAIYAGYGQEVKAGQVVSVTRDMLHMETRYRGEELDPIEFLTMIYGNIAALGHGAAPDIDTIGGQASPYPQDEQEIETLFLRYFPSYMEDLRSGRYVLPQRTEQMLRSILQMASSRHWFFETLPTLSNPMGMGGRSLPAATKVQALLTDDFLSYLALMHGTYVSSWSGEIKKKSMTQPPVTRD